MLSKFHKIPFIMTYVVVSIPLWHYIHDWRVLAFMVFVLAFAYFNVTLITLRTAQQILNSEKAKVSLPHWLPDKPKYYKWWMLIQHTLKLHLLLILPKLGLVFASLEYLRSTPRMYGWYEFLKPYYYGGYILKYPQWETLLLGITVVTVFSFFNQGLQCAIIVAAQGRMTKVLVMGCIVTMICFGIGNTAHSILWKTNPCSHIGARCDSVPLTYRRAKETIYTTTNTFIGQGILLSTNIMRPTSYIYKYDATIDLAYEQQWDNRPFVARQVVAGMLGLLLYAGATWVILWFVEDDKPPQVT